MKRLGAFAVALVCSCDTTAGSLSATDVPTAIAIEPTLFLGTTPCGDGQGSMRSYVATVIDVTSQAAPFAVRSTRPLPCGLPGEIRTDIVAGNRYRVEIDGFELDAGALAPTSQGGREVLDELGDVVVPRWTTACGPDAGVAAVLDVRSLVAPCAALADAGAVGPASVTLSPSATLGTLACSSAGGIVDSFDVTPDAPLATLLDLPCDSPPVVFDDVPLGPLFFVVEARAGAEQLSAGCSASPRAGRRVSAACSPLAASGALALGPGCAPGVVTYRARIGSLFSSGIVACTDDVVFSPLPPASYVATTELFDADGALTDSLTCVAEVSPGQTALADCF